ncbi:hypothetical protein AX16_001976 [Volvariella volvacea WC 439]|nr:hypothetical protein AX16_001976 [Volvariella volvacea WC 439]
MSISPAVVRRLMREISDLRKNPPEGIRIQTSEEDMLDITGIIEGPGEQGTPYAGGYFRVKFKFTEEFPAAPPKCWMATKIFHPNVSGSGEICVNTLKKDWKSEYGIGYILTTVKCLLIYPNPDSALDEEAGKLLQENYDSYCERAKLITSVHANPRNRPPEFDSSANTGSMPTTSGSSTSMAASAPVKPTPSNANAPASLSLPVSVSQQLTSADRHPSPLSTADSNIPAGSSQMATTTKAVKRTAASAASSNAEKRKKALKRL